MRSRLPHPNRSRSMFRQAAFVLTSVLALSAAAALSAETGATPHPHATHQEIAPMVHYRTAAVDGQKLFYREAGDPAAPTLLLLHGFPSSSHMFRDLIP